MQGHKCTATRSVIGEPKFRKLCSAAATHPSLCQGYLYPKNAYFKAGLGVSDTFHTGHWFPRFYGTDKRICRTRSRRLPPSNGSNPMSCEYYWCLAFLTIKSSSLQTKIQAPAHVPCLRAHTYNEIGECIGEGSFASFDTIIFQSINSQQNRYLPRHSKYEAKRKGTPFGFGWLGLPFFPTSICCAR
jgi:hypothetical protein